MKWYVRCCLKNLFNLEDVNELDDFVNHYATDQLFSILLIIKMWAHRRNFAHVIIFVSCFGFYHKSQELAISKFCINIETTEKAYCDTNDLLRQPKKI